jgi:O-antigen/teichoic acid export membrane protein
MGYSAIVLAGALVFAHTLGPSEYGRLAAFIASSGLVVTLATQGVRVFYLREAAGRGENSSLLHELNFVVLLYCAIAAALLMVGGIWLGAPGLLACYGFATAFAEFLLDRARAIERHSLYLVGTLVRAVFYGTAIIVVFESSAIQAEYVLVLLTLVVTPTILTVLLKDPAAVVVSVSRVALKRASAFAFPVALTYGTYYLVATSDRFVFIGMGRAVDAGVVSFYTDIFFLGGMAALMALHLPRAPRMMAAERRGAGKSESSANLRTLLLGGCAVIVAGTLGFVVLSEQIAFDPGYLRPGGAVAFVALAAALNYALCFYHFYVVLAARGNVKAQLVSMLVALLIKLLAIGMFYAEYGIMEAIAGTWLAGLAALGVSAMAVANLNRKLA